MQTFLPYPSYEKSARSLDTKRLGKQRIEARMIYEIITGQRRNSRWRNHPAVKMWENNAGSLGEYYNAILAEWIRRGFQNNMTFIYDSFDKSPPVWLGDADFHRSHQSNLVRKNPEFYGPQFPNDVPNNLEYVWPLG